MSQLSVGARSRESESEVRGPWQISIHSHQVSCDSEGSFGSKGIVMISVQNTNERIRARASVPAHTECAHS